MKEEEMEYWIQEMEMKNDEIWQAMSYIDLNQEHLWFMVQRMWTGNIVQFMLNKDVNIKNHMIVAENRKFQCKINGETNSSDATYYGILELGF